MEYFIDKYPNGLIRRKYSMLNGSLHGPMTCYEDGRLIRWINYHHGKISKQPDYLIYSIQQLINGKLMFFDVESDKILFMYDSIDDKLDIESKKEVSSDGLIEGSEDRYVLDKKSACIRIIKMKNKSKMDSKRTHEVLKYFNGTSRKQFLYSLTNEGKYHGYYREYTRNGLLVKIVDFNEGTPVIWEQVINGRNYIFNFHDGKMISVNTGGIFYSLELHKDSYVSTDLRMRFNIDLNFVHITMEPDNLIIVSKISKDGKTEYFTRDLVVVKKRKLDPVGNLIKEVRYD